jgi:PAS domain S-box-containing protein
MDDRPDVQEGSPAPERLTADGLQGFASASPDLACILDAHGLITAANPAWDRVLGWTRRELVGRSVLELVHDDDLERTRAVLDQVADGGALEDFANRWPHADGGWRWISWSAALGPDGHHVYASGRDLTDRVELQVRSARDAVDLRLALTSERETTAELRRLDHRKDTFLSAVTHDLRSPMMVVQGAAATLTSRRGELLDDEVAQLEQLIVTHSARLSRELDELLDVDRLGERSASDGSDPVDLVAIVERVVGQSRIVDRTSVVAPPTLTVTADPVQVEHIVTNLLDNAAKYAPEGPIVVTIDADRRAVRLGVRDQGPGIPLGALERVFEPFWRGDAVQAGPGTGMGLALVADFARLQGGSAWAEPTTRGAHFVVELPNASAD